MRPIIKLLAGFSILSGIGLIAAGGAMLFTEMPLAVDQQTRVVGLLALGGAGAWCLLAGIRFFRRPGKEHAVAVCKPAVAVAFLVAVSVAFGPRDDASGASSDPLIVPLVGLGVAAGFYFLALKPLARRAYPEAETAEATAMADAGNDSATSDSARPDASMAGAGVGSDTYVLTAPFFRELRRKSAVVSFPIAALAIGGGLYTGAGDEPDWTVTAIVGIGGLVIMGGSMAVAFRRQRRSFESLRIELDEQALRRMQPGYPRLEIRFDELSRLVEVPGKGLLVVGRGKYNQLFLSRHLSDFDTLRRRLGERHAIEIGASSSRSYGLLLLAVLGTLACMVVAFSASDPVLVTITGSLLIALLVGSVVLIQRNPHVDARMKRGLWITALLVCALILRIWSIWSGPR